VRVDSSLSIDTTQTVALTPSAKAGASVTFTAASAVFTTTDIGRRIIKKSLTGYEYGTAEIIAFTSSTVVTCEILEDFDSTTQIPSGGWYLTVSEVTGLEHLEGETVKVVTDGAVHSDEIVTDGAITLDYESTVVHVGLGYRGWIRSMPLNPTTAVGVATSRTMTLDKVGVLFRHTLGAKVGASAYKLEDVVFRSTNDRTGNPPPLFTGVKEVLVKDGYENEKFVHIVQDEPLPCTVQAIIPYVNVTEE
jgi:hypothetical protein